jgi:hypothetical protein
MEEEEGKFKEKFREKRSSPACHVRQRPFGKGRGIQEEPEGYFFSG